MTYLLTQLVLRGELENHDLSSLQTVLFAGEIFPIKYLRQLVEAVPHPQYYNLYGPTETNVITYHHVQPADIAPAVTEPLPIGVACANSDLFVIKADGLRAACGYTGRIDRPWPYAHARLLGLA